MSNALVRAEVKRLLGSKNPEVLFVTGKWGVGKTYAWKTYLREEQEANRVALTKYSYVSLFGCNSIDDLKSAIVEKRVGSQSAESEPSLDTLKATLMQIQLTAGKHLPRLRSLFGFNNYIEAANRLLFLTISEQIICLDDLERMGSGLDLKSVLGLVSFLKEERRCKVVALMNQDALTEESSDYLKAHAEKVADTVITFAPTSEEAAKLGLDQSSKLTPNLEKHIISLQVVNIRVIKKIEALSLRLAVILDGQDPRIIAQALHTVSLATYSTLQPNEAPPLDLIKTFNSRAEQIRMHTVGGASVQEAPHKDFLTQYGFLNADELDLLLIEGVEQGFFDEAAIKALMPRLNSSLNRRDQDGSMQKAWDLLYNSFADDEPVVSDAILKSVCVNRDVLSLSNLSEAVTLLKALGRNAEAAKAIEVYVEGTREDAAFWDLSRNAFRGSITDVDVRAAVDQKFAAMSVSADPVEILTRIAETNSWEPSDISSLLKLVENDFVQMFKSLTGQELHRVIGAALVFRGIGNADEGMRKITSTVENALKTIATETPINQIRVKKYGVNL